MQFEFKSFQDLSTEELYRLLKLRAEVFVVEQNCPYLDVDGLDMDAIHIIGKKEGEIHAYTRIIPPGVVYPEYVSVGRVVTSSKIRKSGLGRPLMHYTIEQCKIHFPNHQVKISAQYYLLKFYNDLGFSETGDQYLEDDIPHIAMVFKD